MSTPARDPKVPITGEHKAVAPPLGARLRSLDLPVVIVAIVLLAAGWRVHAAMTRPSLTTFSHSGLTLQLPSDLGLRQPLVAPPKPPIAIAFRRAGDARQRVEVRIERRQLTLGNVAAGLELERANRYGPVYNRLATGIRTVNGKDWLRTRFSYVTTAPSSGAEADAIATYAVEYAWPADATVNSDVSYVVTVHGSEAGCAGLESIVSDSLKVP